MLISDNKIFFSLLSILPISIVAGPTVSLINMLLIVFLYLFIFFKDKHYKFLFKNNIIRLLFVLYIYLIFNSFISIDFESGLMRNAGFIRLIFLFLAINYFFHISQKNLNVFNIWSIFLLIFLSDVYFEKFTGANIFGWGGNYGPRIVGFFKDEPIAGAYINGFNLLICGYLLLIFKNNQKLYFPLILLFLYFLFSIIITGERSNTFKALFSITLFLSCLDFIKLRSKVLIFLLLIGSFVLVINNSHYLKNRYFDQIFADIILKKDYEFLKQNIYSKLYKSGFEVFKNHPFLGVGNKNYRVETCSEKAKKFDYYCLTHPHQVYFELLSEHGLIGTTILLSIFFYIIFKNLKIILLSQNYIQLGTFMFLLSTFLPLLPSGSFFSDFNITLFFINLSLMYGVNKDTNIFNKMK
tara:strand:- start:322 stop:1554 length:1233 start_codon:yes stop_codon:yes gene_type:complete